MAGERERAAPAHLPVRPPEPCGSAAMEAASPAGAPSASGSPHRAHTARCGSAEGSGSGDEEEASSGEPCALMEVDEDAAGAAEHEEAALTDGSRRARVCRPLWKVVKPHQVEGVRWLFGAFGRGGGLLTDEPGLSHHRIRSAGQNGHVCMCSTYVCKSLP
mmetsp:Transcript_35753/g.93897  ORF Transcript_35753/g.93897 Transcript_35753/m.93897 type:complete len:161 (+) Transcript_35753:35-517(+)